MPPFGRRDDPLKKYGLGLIAAAIVIALWLSSSQMSGTGGDSVHIQAAFDSVDTEQGLQSLDAIDNPQGAPGQALNPGGSYAKTSADIHDPGLSSLYQSPHAEPGAAKGAPIEGDEKFPLADAAVTAPDNLAQAMAQVASAGKKGGWGGQRARSGFKRPKAKFGKVGKTRGGGGASTRAGLVVVKKAFGTGGDPGLAFSASGGFASAQRKGGRIAAAANRSRSLSGLKNTKKQALAALQGNSERAANLASRTFDATGGGGRSLSDLAAQSNSAAMISGAGVPENLKANDPNLIMKKEFEPPEIEEAAEVDDSESAEYMQQKIMMMIISAAISGIAGPAFGAIGGALFGGLSEANTQLGKDNVANQGGS